MSNQPGILFVVSAPSGAGKTSLLKALLEQENDLQASVSYTTRAQRSGEEQGVHYHFIDQEKFREMVEAGEFLEHAEVFGNYYGTAEHAVRQQLQNGTDLVLEIDWQGAQQVRKFFPDAVSVFILPPNVAALRERLSTRGQDDEGVIEARMHQSSDEISHFVEFDFLIVNDAFGQALAEFRTIVCAERLKMQRQATRYNEAIAAMMPADY